MRSSWSAPAADRSLRSPGDLGIYDSTPGSWVRQDRIDRGEREGLTTEERVRLRQLEAENTRLRMEHDPLKRTVAVWVKERSTVAG